MTYFKIALLLQYKPSAMVRLIALIISIVLQIIAASFALGFIKLTRYRLSWILFSLSFSFMAVRKIIQLVELYRGTPSYIWQMIDEWMGVLISFMIIVGVILIREIFYSLKRAEIDRLRTERKVLNAIINTEENEKRRFAKDLHDGLGPILSTVKMSLSSLNDRINDPSGSEILSNANYLVNEAINAIKDISNNMSPHILSNFGLASAVSTFVSKINQTNLVEIGFKTNMEKTRIENDKEVVLYRAVCELINNSIRHSGASRIGIELNKHEKIVTLQFYDNGRGFDMSVLNSDDNKGMGLSNIETRVKTVEGVFILESTPGKGTNALLKVTD
jgi:signal transduction histidine kinase